MGMEGEGIQGREMGGRLKGRRKKSKGGEKKGKGSGKRCKAPSLPRCCLSSVHHFFPGKKQQEEETSPNEVLHPLRKTRNVSFCRQWFHGLEGCGSL